MFPRGGDGAGGVGLGGIGRGADDNKGREAMKRLIVVVLMVMAPLGSALGWWNDDWQYRKQIRIDTSTPEAAAIEESVAGFPLLIRLHMGNFNYFGDMKADGSDVRFVSGDDTTALSFHVEKFDPVDQIALVWVRLPTLTAGSGGEYVWMYYGNPEAVAASDPAATFDKKQTLVYHFQEGQSVPKDATAYGNDARTANAEVEKASLIAAGLRFNGEGGVTLPDSPTLRVTPAEGYSLSGWFKPAADGMSGPLLEYRGGQNSLSLTLNGGVPAMTIADIDGAGLQVEGGAALQADTWHHLAATVQGQNMSLYLDGQLIGQAQGAIPEIGGEIWIGANDSAAWRGQMDELRLAATARPGAWLAASAVNQAAMGGGLIAMGPDEQFEGGGGASHFGVILRSVTVDGWVVIVILAIMGVFSWFVMGAKGVVVQRARSGNEAFLKLYREATRSRYSAGSALNEGLLREAEPYSKSPLFRIYSQGVEETRQRLGSSAGAAAVEALSPSAMGAIRAGLDATMVRENQRLNSQMVLLTIAISGGPFLGLLGTVVGVMITFAAVAAAGEVNINAIAPGMAAALLATVAGLAVAIPALFGYNYLASRIKEISADMEVFADEFIGRVSEEFGR